MQRFDRGKNSAIPLEMHGPVYHKLASIIGHDAAQTLYSEVGGVDVFNGIMMNADMFCNRIRIFDPLGISAWVPLSEFDYMIPIIEGFAGLPEKDFIARATAYFMRCFSDGELVRSKEEVISFFNDLYLEISK